MKTIRLLSGATGLALLATIGSAQANVTFDFNVDGVAATTVGRDKVAVNANNGAFSLAVGQTADITLQSLTWATANTGASTLGSWDLSRNIYVTYAPNTIPGSITSQYGILQSNGKKSTPDSLAITQGDTIEFTFGNYILDVTPDAGGVWTQKPNNTSTQYLTATVQLTAVPESSTVIAGAGALGLLILGAGVHSKRTVQRIG